MGEWRWGRSGRGLSGAEKRVKIVVVPRQIFLLLRHDENRCFQGSSSSQSEGLGSAAGPASAKAPAPTMSFFFEFMQLLGLFWSEYGFKGFPEVLASCSDLLPRIAAGNDEVTHRFDEVTHRFDGRCVRFQFGSQGPT